MREIRALIPEFLRDKHTGQYAEATQGVACLAIKHGVLKQAGEPLGDQYLNALSLTDSAQVREEVRQELWHLLVQGLLVFGMGDNNPNSPWYRLTERGVAVVSAQSPQPYDPTVFYGSLRARTPRLTP